MNPGERARSLMLKTLALAGAWLCLLVWTLIWDHWWASAIAGAGLVVCAILAVVQWLCWRNIR